MKKPKPKPKPMMADAMSPSFEGNNIPGAALGHPGMDLPQTLPSYKPQTVQAQMSKAVLSNPNQANG